MNLRIYLATKNMTLSDFSKLLEYDAAYLSMIMNGHKLPGRKLARKIERLTDGNVKFKDKKCTDA